jgi:NAD(P)-dependent dehydrogenase (short-subunit alcohol dehydrogenase family)
VARYLITGATRGIGRALVDVLAPLHEVIALGRSAAALDSLPVASRVVADLADPGCLSAAVPELAALDGVVHCAGVIRPGRVEELDVAAWLDQFTVNVTAPAELTRLLLPALRAAEGSVVFVNSGSGRRARAGMTGYGASKFAMRALADGLREEEPSLRVSTVYPGPTATDMQRTVQMYEGGTFVASDHTRPETVAGVIAQVLAMPADAVQTEVVIRPH